MVLTNCFLILPYPDSYKILNHIDLDILDFWVHGFFNSLVIGMIVVTKDMMGSAITKTAIATKNFNL